MIRVYHWRPSGLHAVQAASTRFHCLLTLCLALIMTACAPPEKPTEAAPPPGYPPPPEKTRYYFERQVRNSGDVMKLDDALSLRVMLTGETGEDIQSLSKPFSVAVHQGRIFVSDSVSRRVHVFDVPLGKAFSIGTQGPVKLIKPLGMSVDRAGNLYVADITQRAAYVFDRDGNYLNAFGGKELLDRPNDIVVNPEGTRAFVVDTGGVTSSNHRIVVFDPRTGEHLYNIGTRGTGEGQFNLPREADIGPDGRLYVVDGGNFRIQVLEQDGTFVRAFGQAGRQFGQFARPKGIAVDPQGLVYVADAAFGNFQIFTPEGELLMWIGERLGGGGGPGDYILPAGIDVDEDGRIYVVDQFYRKLDVYRPAELGTDEGYLGAAPAVAPPQ